MSPRTYASSAIVLIDAMRVGRTGADGQFGQALCRNAGRPGHRNRLIIAGTEAGTLRLLGVWIPHRRGHASATASPGLAAATTDGPVRRRIRHAQPSDRRRRLRAGECQDCQPALHQNVQRQSGYLSPCMIVYPQFLRQVRPKTARRYRPRIPAVVSAGQARQGCLQ